MKLSVETVYPHLMQISNSAVRLAIDSGEAVCAAAGSAMTKEMEGDAPFKPVFDAADARSKVLANTLAMKAGFKLIVQKAGMDAVNAMYKDVGKKAAKKVAHLHAYDASKWAFRKTSEKLCLGQPKPEMLLGKAFSTTRLAALKGAETAAHTSSVAIVKDAFRDIALGAAANAVPTAVT